MSSGVELGPDRISEALESPQEYEAVNTAQLLWESRRFIVRSIVTAAVIAAIVSFLLPVRYKSTARFLPSDIGERPLLAMAAKAAGGGAADLIDAGGLLGNKTNGALYLQIISSRSMQDVIIDKFDLRRMYRDRYYKDARKDLSKYTSAQEDRTSGVITISVTDKDARRAAQITEAYLQEISRLSNELNTSSARNERVFIEQRLETAKSDLDNASKALSEFSSQNAAIDITAQARSMIEGAATLQGELIAAQAELRGLEQIYAPTNVRVKAAQARIAELRRQLDKVGGYKSADGKADLGVEDIYPSIRRLPVLGLRYAELYRRAKIQETIFMLLTQRYEDAKIQEAKELPTIKVLDPPDIPERKDSPSRTLIVFAAVLCAGIGASIFVIGHHKWSDTAEDHPGKKLIMLIVSTASGDLHRLFRMPFGRASKVGS